jgi:hypothetical protein
MWRAVNSVLRGATQGLYSSHYIKRRPPHGPIRDLGELFIELAGSQAIKNISEYSATFPMRS